MGCDLCVYTPKFGDEDCGMAYSTFNRVRISIIQLYLMKMKVDVDVEDGEVLPLNMGIVPESLHKRVSDALSSINSPEASGMLEFWNHSDSDGIYWSEDCEHIAIGIKKILNMFDKDDDDKDRAEALMNLFESAGRNMGIVVVC